MQAVFLVAHNVRTGMFDYRAYDPVPSAQALVVFELLRKVMDGLVVDRERALDEVRSDYSTTTEIADALLQRAGVPFRVGHHFASALTDYGRARGLKLHEIPHAVAARLYEDGAAQPFPLGEGDLREVISAEYMVFGRKGRGGPQLAEVDRMLSQERAGVASDRAWSAAERGRLARAHADLDTAIALLAQGSSH
jgi:argininosuccinate lyase